jgi:hypothetical protein
MVLLVRNAICMPVCLNMLVISYVSFPMYVKAAHFRLGDRVICCRVVFLVCCLCDVRGKELLCIMLWMVLGSCLYSVSLRS